MGARPQSQHPPSLPLDHGIPLSQHAIPCIRSLFSFSARHLHLHPCSQLPSPVRHLSPTALTLCHSLLPAHLPSPVLHLSPTAPPSCPSLFLAGELESQALLREIHQERKVRPLTHDVAKDLLAIAGFRVTKIRITDIIANTYYARIHVARQGEAELDVDARPSGM